MKVKKKKLGILFWISGAFVMLLMMVSFFSYIISPDHTPNANRIHLSLALQRPGFKVTMLQIKKTSQNAEQSSFFSGYDDLCEYIPIKYMQLDGNKINYIEFSDDTVGDRMLSLPINKLYTVDGKSFTQTFNYILGTDRYGRDVLSRLMVGAGASLSVGFVAVIISLLLGLLLGLVAGYYQGFVDTAVSWLINVIWSLPTLLIVIAITLALGKGFWQIFVAVGLTMWVEVARMVRGQVLSIREKEYIMAARTLGANNFRIIFKHILPNLTGPLIVVCTANFAGAILLEAGLSFLGIGIQPPQPSWGQMLRDHSGYIVLDKAWLAMAPGLCIMLLVIAFNMMGNALRDRLDVR